MGRAMPRAARMGKTQAFMTGTLRGAARVAGACGGFGVGWSE